MRVSKIIWIEGDDGRITLSDFPTEDVSQASIVITDQGRILKNRLGQTFAIIPSFDLVKNSPVKLIEPLKKNRYRSIYDPMDVQADL